MTLEPLLQATPAIQIHTVSAILAFFLGGIVLFRRKGGRLHRLSGRVWVLLMLIVAISSFFIHMIRMVGPWSPIHLLSIFVLVSLFFAVAAARQGWISAHRKIMSQMYLGALIGAGLFTFLPGRIMHEVFFSGPRPWIGVVAFALLLVVIILLVYRIWREPA